MSLIIYMCLNVNVLYGQLNDEETEQLKRELKNSLQDTAKVNLLNNLAEKLKSTGIEEGLNYAEESIMLADELDYQKGKARALYIKGGFYHAKNSYDSAIYFFETGLMLSAEIGDSVRQAAILNQVGLAYRSKGRVDDAIDAHRTSYKIRLHLADSIGIANSLNNLGSALKRSGRQTEALKVYNDALAIASKINHRSHQGNILLNLGNVYLERRDHHEALEYYLSAKQIFEELGNKERTARILSNMANAYGNIGEYVKALGILRKALLIKEELGNEKSIASTLSNIGNIYYSILEPVKALEYHHRATTILEEIDDKLGVAIGYNLLGSDYLSMDSLERALYYYHLTLPRYQKINKCYEAYALVGLAAIYSKLNIIDSAIYYYSKSYNYAVECQDLSVQADGQIGWAKVEEAKGDLTSAEKKLLEGRKKAIQGELKLLQKDAAFLLYRIYKSQNKFEEAIKYYEEYQIINDTLFNQEKVRKLALAEAQHEFDREKRELQFEQERKTLQLEEEKKRLNIRLFASLGGLGLLLITAILIIRAYKGKTNANKKLSLANNKLHQLDQFKTRLFANINHDFRTPLTLILGYISKLNADSNTFFSKNAEADLQHLQRNSLTMVEMTNEIQDLLLLEESKLKLTYNKVVIVDYLGRLVRMFSSMADVSNLRLNYYSDIDENTIVHLDRNHFDKIFYNVVSNAFRYTPDGGEITVDLSLADSFIKMKVSDTGRGIDLKDLPHIFDRFYQSPLNEYRSKEGFGIGLAVVKELVELHQGDIKVESEVGKGTMFEITLPLNLDKKVVEMPTEAESLIEQKLPTKEANTTMISTKQKEKQTILVVDDHEEIRQYIVGLIANNYNTKEASNGKQALTLLKKNHVDLILTDLMMPWLDGYDLIERLQEEDNLRDIPVMVVSARTTEEDKHRVLDAGVNEFISKPFDPNELQKRIHNILVEKKKKQNVWEDVINNQETQSNLEKNIANKLNQIILDNISNQELTIELLADQLSASRSKTIRLIKSITGQTPHAYIKSIRMDHVDRLIKTRKIKNASEAINAIGMTNVTHFASQYKKHFGYAPDYGNLH